MDVSVDVGVDVSVGVGIYVGVWVGVPVGVGVVGVESDTGPDGVTVRIGSLGEDSCGGDVEDGLFSDVPLNCSRMYSDCHTAREAICAVLQIS